MRVNILLLCLVASSLLGAKGSLADCALPKSGVSDQQASKVKVLAADAGGTVCQDCIDEAAAEWNGSCEAGSKPEIVLGTETSQITAIVRFRGGSNPGGFVAGCSADACACAEVQQNQDTGDITLADVHIWQSAGGQNCDGSATEILTHEFAHVLGIEDPPRGCPCSNIMGSVFGSIDTEVCDQVDKNFQTSGEAGTGSGGDDHQCSSPPAT